MNLIGTPTGKFNIVEFYNFTDIDISTFSSKVIALQTTSSTSETLLSYKPSDLFPAFTQLKSLRGYVIKASEDFTIQEDWSQLPQAFISFESNKYKIFENVYLQPISISTFNSKISSIQTTSSTGETLLVYKPSDAFPSFTQLTPLKGYIIRGKENFSITNPSFSANRITNYGDTVAMNSTGNIVAVFNSVTDKVEIFEKNIINLTWSLLGSAIVGQGNIISINADGNIIAIGNSGYDTGDTFNIGSTKIYQWNSSTSTWNQIGQNIIGDAAGDYSGYSVSLNSDGDRVAIGAIYNDNANGQDSGSTKIYQWNSSTSTWDQIGQNIIGDAAGDYSGYSVRMNAAGDRVAIGASYNDSNGQNSGSTKIYEWNSSTSTWDQIGQNIIGDAAGDYSGYSVRMNAAGTRVIIGAPGYDSTLRQYTSYVGGGDQGLARVYEFNNSSWTKMGQDITFPIFINDQLGIWVDINDNGDVIAVSGGGSRKDAGIRTYGWNHFNSTWQLISQNNGYGGQVELNNTGNIVLTKTLAFDIYNSNNTIVDMYSTPIYIAESSPWSQYGNEIIGLSHQSKIGESLHMNEDGDRIAFLRYANSIPFYQVYQWNSSTSTWGQMGQNITTDNNFSSVGNVFSINATSSIIAYGNRGVNNNAGVVRIYQWNSGTSTWVQMGQDITGGVTGAALGDEVRLNAAGDRVAIGIPGPYTGGFASTARIYQWNSGTSTWVQMGQDIPYVNIGDQTGTYLDINDVGDRVAVFTGRSTGEMYQFIKVYGWDAPTSSWLQVGDKIIPTFTGVTHANSEIKQVLLNNAGDKLFLSVTTNLNTRVVRAYTYNESNNSWIQLGQDIFNNANYSEISINSNGSRISIPIKAEFHSDPRTQIYDYNSSTSTWIKLGNEFNDIPRALTASLNSVGDKIIVSNYNENTLIMQGNVATETVINGGTIRAYSLDIL